MLKKDVEEFVVVFGNISKDDVVWFLLVCGDACSRRDPSRERELARLPHRRQPTSVTIEICQHLVPLTDSLPKARNVPILQRDMLGLGRFYAPKVAASLSAHGSAMPGLQGPDEITSRDGGLRLAFCPPLTPIRVLEREE
jgi:hypothetical protein